MCARGCCNECVLGVLLHFQVHRLSVRACMGRLDNVNCTICGEKCWCCIDKRWQCMTELVISSLLILVVKDVNLSIRTCFLKKCKALQTEKRQQTSVNDWLSNRLLFSFLRQCKYVERKWDWFKVWCNLAGV